MFGKGFKEVHENYELAKVFSKTRDLDGLKIINWEIGKFWESRPIMSNDELELIIESEESVKGYLCGHIENDLAGIWEYSLDGDISGMINAEMNGLQLFYGLKSRDILTHDVTLFTRGRLDEIRWLCNSSVYTSLLENFEKACLNGDDVYDIFRKICVFSDENPVKGPRFGLA